MKNSTPSKWIEQHLSHPSLNRHEYFESDGVLIQKKLHNQDDTIWSESIFAKRSSVPYTTTWCEQQLGESLLDRALSEAAIKPDDLVMDLGCGDGRYVHALLARGAQKIIALNYELKPLKQLQASLSPDEQERVTLICGDVNEHPLKKELGSFVIAWGLWTSTPDFSQAMQNTIDIVKPNGFLLNAEPVLEHALTYALTMGNHEEFLNTLTTKTRPRMWDELESRYRVQTLSELRSLMKHPKIDTLWEDGISVLPSLLYGGLFTQETVSDETKEALWEALKNTRIEWFRQMVYLSRKIAG